MMFLVYIDVELAMFAVSVFGIGTIICWAYVPYSTRTEVLKSGVTFAILLLFSRCLVKEVKIGICNTEVTAHMYSEGQLSVSHVSTICTTTSFNPRQYPFNISQTNSGDVEQRTAWELDSPRMKQMMD